jgi:hypothetical protein
MKTSWLFGLVTCLYASAAPAAPQCTQQTTRGYWVYTCEGELPIPEMTPVRLLGTCSTSREAYWTCEGSANLGGLVLPQVLRGQANNNDNCTGTITYTNTVGGQSAGTLDIRYVISDGGSAINGLPTNSGGVLACALDASTFPTRKS